MSDETETGTEPEDQAAEAVQEHLEDVLERIKTLRKGPRGRQNEPGFQVVEDLEGFEPIRFVPLFVVLCKDDKKPDPQYRFVSPHELFPDEGEEAVLEVRDRLMAVRIRDPAGPVSQIVVGGRDDVAEVVGKSGIRWGLSLALPGLARLAGFALKLPGLLEGLAGKVAARLEGGAE